MLTREVVTRVWISRCGKWAYNNRPEAMDHLIRIRTELKNRRSEKAVYKCRRCKGWHMTSQVQKEWMNNAPDIRKRMEKRRLRSERKAKKSKKASNP